jgi:hypothetical protein
MKTKPKLFHKGSLITYLSEGGDKEQCLGYLMHFEGHGVYEPTFGRVDVTPQEADAHNAALSRAEIEGLDNNCRIGMGGAFYLGASNGKSTVRTFIGDIVAEDVAVKGDGVTFHRKGMTFRGRKRDDELLFFKRVA